MGTSQLRDGLDGLNAWAAAAHTQFPRSVLNFSGAESTSCAHVCPIMHGIVLSFYFYWLHIICYKFWFCSDESPLCLLQSPFPMLQNRFNFSQCLLTSSQFAFLFWDATHKGTTLGLQIECADRGLYVYRKVTAQSFCWAEGSCRETHSWPQPQTLFPQQP